MGRDFLPRGSGNVVARSRACCLIWTGLGVEDLIWVLIRHCDEETSSAVAAQDGWWARVCRVPPHPEEAVYRLWYGDQFAFIYHHSNLLVLFTSNC